MCLLCGIKTTYSVFEANVGIVKFLDGHLKTQSFSPDRIVVVVEDGTVTVGGARRRFRSAVENAVLNSLAVLVDHHHFDFDVSSRRFPAALKNCLLQSQIQIIPGKTRVLGPSKNLSVGLIELLDTYLTSPGMMTLGKPSRRTSMTFLKTLWSLLSWAASPTMNLRETDTSPWLSSPWLPKLLLKGLYLAVAFFMISSCNWWKSLSSQTLSLASKSALVPTLRKKGTVVMSEIDIALEVTLKLN